MGRWFFHDRTELFVWVNMMTAYVYLPAYGVVLLAALFRRWRLVAAAGGIVIVHLIWLWPGLAAAGPPGDAGRTLRLFSANVLFTNLETEPLLAEIRAADPDIVLLQEYSPVWQAAFTASELPQVYPYRLLNPLDTPFGTAIWSKLPLQDAELWDVDGIVMNRAAIVVDGQLLRLYNVHPPPPTNAFYRWNGRMALLVGALQAEAGPLIAVGDFNVTPQNYWYGEIVNGRLRSAHQDQGRGWAVTWPNGSGLMPPIRLDHAFLSPELACLSITEGQGIGSDHKPLIVDVALRR